MTYGKFSTYEEVATKFQIKLAETSFIQETPFSINKELFDFINDNLKLRRSYISKNAICENIIAPILTIITKHHQLPLWSHIDFNVSEEEGLVGIPDFIIAPASDIGTIFTQPIICIAEAKKENFNAGWAQVLAEMIAAQKFNNNDSLTLFGIVTTGNFWQFGKLQKNILTLEIIALAAVENLQKLLNVLNWLVIEAKQHII